jgi:hypothetical protein
MTVSANPYGSSPLATACSVVAMATKKYPKPIRCDQMLMVSLCGISRLRVPVYNVVI